MSVGLHDSESEVVVIEQERLPIGLCLRSKRRVCVWRVEVYV